MKLTKEQLLKILKVALYVGVSNALGALAAFVQGNPDAFGIYGPIINVLLVTAIQLFKTEE
ncbi:hypothetical protein LRM44_03945 [Candidatus Nanosynbacter sp. HMT-352]|jgi:hypothetical protein|uniref:Uncharacterized protein n=1 Tax=Myoviridae sp. ctNYa18 TaxID=2825090 RepID=A0A8S5PFL7_9CAUD|nr:hypothetical protein [Candidatus Nanosynbacter sp. HMT-352]MBF1042273.1 hypothetical protein [Candidatus Nanosynbacter sp.]DAE05975.1 MAG TPA: hypothetical protein [Myoviridae sp. ctNYa18]DAI27487.1 MAG TPA: hypothetical protein [Caudoviricetes sp.]UOG66413.1 hypothetical protein LRM44_03945 [Candidatus Nanosynbacter sp. HMT-352]DAR94129.1 MAG TPA: hypothetical protein [Caudoviricetes sp.]